MREPCPSGQRRPTGNGAAAAERALADTIVRRAGEKRTAARILVMGLPPPRSTHRFLLHTISGRFLHDTWRVENHRDGHGKHYELHEPRDLAGKRKDRHDPDDAEEQRPEQALQVRNQTLRTQGPGAVAVVRLVNIKSPFRDQMTILSGSRQATETGNGKADTGARPQADTAAREPRHAAEAAADVQALTRAIGRRAGGGKPTRYRLLSRNKAAGGGGGPTGNGPSACRYDSVGRPRPGHGGSHRLDRRTDFFYIPFRVASLNDRQPVCYLEFCAGNSALAEQLP